MKTVDELLMDAPDDQVTRCQLAWKAVAADVRALADACAARIGTA
ncbi:hypothetical protein BW21_6317 (plasmid) [Burkholderia humptydooensis]|uniref:Uncharacterized protein n=1 Tax=Burkholderia humptydooensis MSMB43 TaxID=441157 RepID=A0ABN0FX93_9BURK|nr:MULTISPECIES: hypothetical protein [Burkholderia]AJY38184.1 hypothetical protein BW21_6317 [Burkholderia sp. 2002721687]EIP84596.1 hypothetical protein A33K_18761 [Burkholderia humptydooensis MSMB43]